MIGLVNIEMFLFVITYTVVPMFHLQSSTLNKIVLVVRVLRGVLLNVCVNIDLLVLTLFIIGIIAP